MDVYLKLPGHAGASARKGYRGWLPLELVEFERPLLEKEPTHFTAYRPQDSLSRVFARHLEKKLPFARIRVHYVEGTGAISKLRFDDVRVTGWSVKARANGGVEAQERVEFLAERWQYD